MCLGNSYANSVLQALYFCQPFRDLVCATPDSFREDFPAPAPPPTSPTPIRPPPSQLPPSSDLAHQQATPGTNPLAPLVPTLQNPPPPTLFSALRALYLHISTHPSTRGVIAPSSFITKLKKENELFRGTAHQDAHEFLNFLLNKIVEDLQHDQYARPPPPVQTVVSSIDADRREHISPLVMFQYCFGLALVSFRYRPFDPACESERGKVRIFRGEDAGVHAAHVCPQILSECAIGELSLACPLSFIPFILPLRSLGLTRAITSFLLTASTLLCSLCVRVISWVGIWRLSVVLTVFRETSD